MVAPLFWGGPFWGFNDMSGIRDITLLLLQKMSQTQE